MARAKTAGEAVHELLGGRPLPLRLFDEVDDAGQGRILDAPGDGHLQRAVPVQASRIDRIPRPLLDRDGFAGDGRLVHRRASTLDDPVTGQLFPGTDQEEVAHPKLLHGNDRLPTVSPDARLSGSEVHQGPDGAAGPVHRASLEPVRDGVKEGDHRALLPLPDEGGAGHRPGHHPIHVEPEPGEGAEALTDRGVSPDQHGSGEKRNGCARRIAEEPDAPSRQDEEARQCHPELGQAMNPPHGPHDRCALQSGDGPIVLEGLADDGLRIERPFHGELRGAEVQSGPGDPRE